MLKRITDVKHALQDLGLSDDESEVYLTLLHAPTSPLALSQSTGIKRTKIYSLLADLEKRSLICRIANEEGSLFGVTDPMDLSISLSKMEAQLKERQATFQQLLPTLNALRGVHPLEGFTVRTYEGEEGFKQMLWHELKAKGEQLSLGGGDVEELVSNKTWAERYRERVVEAGYRIREIINSEIDLPTPIHNSDYLQLYNCRGISAHILPLENQAVIYNDNVDIFNWRGDKKVGVEIVDKAYANTMRAMFDYFWRLTQPAK
jgi:predicted transcriptional regulator